METAAPPLLPPAETAPSSALSDGEPLVVAFRERPRLRCVEKGGKDDGECLSNLEISRYCTVGRCDNITHLWLETDLAAETETRANFNPGSVVRDPDQDEREPIPSNCSRLSSHLPCAHSTYHQHPIPSHLISSHLMFVGCSVKRLIL